jgi:hypothetical protein
LLRGITTQDLALVAVKVVSSQCARLNDKESVT